MQRPFGVVARSVHGDEGAGLDRVTQRRSGAVCLDEVDVTGVQARVGECGAHDLLLGGAAGRGDAVAGAVLVDGRALDEGEDAVAVAAGVGEPFQDEDADAFGEAGAVGGGRERLADPVGGQAALPAEGAEGAGAAHDGDSAGQREIGLAGPQGPGGQVQGDQGGGAGGVDRDGGPLQTEGVGDAAGYDAGGVAGQQIPVEPVGCLVQPGAVLLRFGSDEHAGAAAPQPVGDDAGAFQCLPHRLQYVALLGVHGQRLAGRDAEEVGVEVGGVGEEPAVPYVAAGGGPRVRVVEGFEVPATVVGEGVGDVPSFGDQPPQLLRGADPARVAAADADDGDRIVVVGPAGARRCALVGRGVDAEQFGAQVSGESGRGDMVEADGGRQGEAGGGAESPL
ncbi:hypothetical protein GCM10022284_55960 [Streptomyces hundungensis]